MKVISTINRSDALDMHNATYHFMHRIHRLSVSGLGIGTVVRGFLVDNEHKNGLEEHYITSTGLIIIRNHNTHKTVTVLVARMGQIKRYFKALHMFTPDKLLDVAYHNTVINNYNYC